MSGELPVEWANYLSIVGFLFLAVVVWLIPKERVYAEAPDMARWRDFRIWATVLICIQLALYSLFA